MSSKTKRRLFTVSGIIAVLVVMAIIVKAINFGALTIEILERTAGVDIAYRGMRGNIFQGFHIEGYRVKLSETDSIYGEIADISYRFSPFSLRLPNLFQANLLEPTVCLQRQGSGKSEPRLSLPYLNLGLRLNVKNGRVIYRIQEPLVIENISGLILVDMVQGKVFLNTMNLSLRTRQYPINITSANINANIEQNLIELKSFRIKGKGLNLHGSGQYRLDPDRLTLSVEKAELDLEAIGVYKGVVDFSGEIEYQDENLLPRIQGRVNGLKPFDRFDFETASSSDTIWINVFDGEIWKGRLFAYARLIGLKDFEFESNFKDLDLGQTIESPQPILASGYMVYRNRRFKANIHSPKDRGVGIDSIYAFGVIAESRIILDSLLVRDDGRSLAVSGSIMERTRCDLNFVFTRFNIGSISNPWGLEGEINGRCRIRGDLKNPRTMIFTSEITAKGLAIADLSCAEVTIKSKDFQPSAPDEYLELTAGDLLFEGRQWQRCSAAVVNNEFLIDGQQGGDSILIKGRLTEVWNGEIEELRVKYYGVETMNRAPISFDILKRRLGPIDLSFCDGSLKATIDPLQINLQDIDLEKLGKLFGLKPPMAGKLTVLVNKGRFDIDTRAIDFIGLKDGSLQVAGELKDQGLQIRNLTILDRQGQHLEASGFLHPVESRISCRFDSVGIWIFPFLNKILTKPEAQVSGSGSIRGNINDFKIDGSAEMRYGSFTLNVISARFDSITSKIRFDGNRIIFETGEGIVSALSNIKSPTRARVTGGGVVKLEPRFGCKNLNFDFSFKDAPIQYPPFAFGIGSGNFSVGTKERIAYYNGSIVVKEGTVPIEFGVEAKPEEEESENWTMNLRVIGERNIWLRNREADIEFGGELNVVKQQTPLYLSGTMETRRGNFYWLSHVLSITQGKVTFIPKDEIDADLDIWAEMDTREGVKILLHCSGTLSEPVFEFFSDPPIYSEQDIITYLNLNITWQELESLKRGEYVGRVLPQSLLSWLESDVSRRIRQYTGLDYFRFETPFESEEKTKITFGKYLSRKLFITYTYGLTTFSNEFNVEYFIDDKNEILIKRDDTGEYSLQYQYRIRF